MLASRLSEDADKTVLVLEAGDTGDAVRSRIDIPTQAYFNGLVKTSYDWGHQTEPQPGLGGRSVYWPAGKVLGGSAAMNGMYMVRPSATELDAIASLQGNASNAGAWGWDGMFAAMKKARFEQAFAFRLILTYGRTISPKRSSLPLLPSKLLAVSSTTPRRTGPRDPSTTLTLASLSPSLVTGLIPSPP